VKNVRWYEANLNASKLKRLADAMLRDAYRASRPWGFRLSDRRKERLIGSYCERVERVDEVTDPFGKVTEYPRVEYRVIEFTLGSEFPAIELHGPSRSVGDLFVHLAEYVGYDVLVSPIHATVASWLGALEKYTSVQVTALEIAAIAMTTQVNGRLWVEGTSDVRSALRDIVGRRSHRIARARISWKKDDADGGCELRELGRARIVVGRPQPAVDLLRASLREARDASETANRSS